MDTYADPHGSCSVLVVEDDEDLRELVCASLEAHGYVVGGAPDGRAALEWLARAGPPDLVLLDLEMPVMDGWELLRRLRAIDSRIRVLVMSGVAPDEAPRGVSFLCKPTGTECLLAAVRRETRRPRPRAPAIVSAAASLAAPTSARTRPR